MWYDLVVLGLLIYFTLRGASKGVVWQLAGIAGLVLCLAFASSISGAFGPYVNLEPPLNNWVVMFGAYLVFSFVAFGFARVMNDWIEKSNLEHFNRHLGAIFGLLKGVVICLVLTFFVVTLSPKAREALQNSKSGYAAAVIMDRLHPVMPEKLHVALGDYIHLLDAPGMDLHSHGEGDDHDHDHSELPDPFGQHTGGDGWTGVPSQPGQVPIRSPIEDFVARLPQSLGSDLKTAIGRSLENTPPEQRSAAQQQLLAALARVQRPEDLNSLKQQLTASGSRSLGDTLANWFSGSTPTQPVSQPSTPRPTQPTTPPVSPSRKDQLVAEISRAFSSIPPVQVQVQNDIRQRLTGVPDAAALAVLEDWRRDLWAPQSPDPDPATDAQSTLEVRIVNQLQARGIPINRLSSEVQDRLDGATLR